jgi:hypothetical protein
MGAVFSASYIFALTSFAVEPVMAGINVAIFSGSDAGSPERKSPAYPGPGFIVNT